MFCPFAAFSLEIDLPGLSLFKIVAMALTQAIMMEMRPLPGKFPQSRAKIEYFCVHVHDCNAFSC
jgi:hypothetical protein